MADDTLSLNHYGALNGYLIHVIDNNPMAKHGEFDDVSQIEKYVMKDSDYDTKEDTFRNFKKRQLAKNPNWKVFEGSITQNEQEEESKAISVGQRCETEVGARRGEVKYVGRVKGLKWGFWVGVKLDEPVGDSDGTVNGKTYIPDCPDKFGMFVRPKNLKVGDYPEIDEFDMDDDMI